MKFKDFIMVVLIVVVCIFIYDKKKANDLRNEVLQVSQQDKNYESIEDKGLESSDSVKKLVAGFLENKKSDREESTSYSEVKGIIEKVVDDSKDLSEDNKKTLIENLYRISESVIKEKNISIENKEDRKKFEIILKNLLKNEKARELLENKSLYDGKGNIDLEELKDSLKNGADLSYNIIKEFINY